MKIHSTSNRKMALPVTKSVAVLGLFTLFAVSFLFLIPEHFSNPWFHKLSATQSEPQIHLTVRAVYNEGMGAVIQGMKPLLLLRNHTGARVILLPRRRGAHGYDLGDVLHLERPPPPPRTWLRWIPRLHPPRRTVRCPVPQDRLKALLGRIDDECERFDWGSLREHGIFQDCNTLHVDEYLARPMKCLVHTEALVRAFTRFVVPTPPPVSLRRDYEDVCVLRRGGDVEERIMKGVGNQWAVDEEKTLPILRDLKQLGRRIVVSTETTLDGVAEKYSADVFSNREPLQKVISRLLRCRCLFVAASSSFQASIAQIVAPMYFVYTESRPGFSFDRPSFAYWEYGDRALSVLSGKERIVEVCGHTNRSEEEGS